MDSASIPLVRVVAAVISENDRYLITQRRAQAVLPGLWEFPGGKVEKGESDEDALVREVKERIDVSVTVGARMAVRRHEYEGYAVELSLYEAFLAPNQTPRAARVADFVWARSEDFETYRFPAADQATTDALLGIKRS